MRKIAGMATRKSPDGHGLICDFSNAKCELHGGKLKECGCHPIWVDREWLAARSAVRIRRRAAVYRRAHERTVLEKLLGLAADVKRMGRRLGWPPFRARVP